MLTKREMLTEGRTANAVVHQSTLGANGRDRKTITKHLEKLPFIDGDKGAHLYESSKALPLIYAIDNLEAARAKQALSQASLNAVREEDLRKQRIPTQIALSANDQAIQSFAATLKAAKNKKLMFEARVSYDQVRRGTSDC
jgi:hypothetical protein